MMQAEKVYHIYYDAENRYVVMNWAGYATSTEFKKGTESMLNILVENQARKVLGDTRHMDIIGQEEQHWLENSFIPKALTQGFKAIALLKPISYFNQVALENMKKKALSQKIQIEIFDDIEQAKSWLNNLPF